MQDILALARNYRQWTAGPRYGAGFAAAHGGTLSGIFVCEPILPPPATTTPLAIPQMYTISAEIVREARSAESSFVRWAHDCGVPDAHWLVAEGHLAQALAQAANWHDLLVLEAGGDSPFGGVGALGHVLLTCGAPCIVVPQSFAGPVTPQTIAVGWKGTAESVRALHAALPLLRQAQRIVLIEGGRDEPFSSVGWTPAFEIDAFLARRRLRVEKVPLRSADQASGRAAARRRRGGRRPAGHGRLRAFALQRVDPRRRDPTGAGEQRDSAVHAPLNRQGCSGARVRQESSRAAARLPCASAFGRWALTCFSSCAGP